VGKTTLAHLIGTQVKNPLILDLESGSLDLDAERISDISSWEALRAAVQAKDLWQDRGALILDSATTAEEMAIKWVINNVPHEKGFEVKSIDDYGWGQGYGYLYDQFLLLLADLDRHIENGRHIILIAHDSIANVPNPAGIDWIRYEPRLYSPSSGKSSRNSVRLRIKEWCDHLLFLGWDVTVDKSGRAIGGGTRTIHPLELPIQMAKSRTLSEPIPFQNSEDSTLWETLLRKD